MTELLHLGLPVMLARAPRPSAVTPHRFLGGDEGRDWVLGSALGPSMAGRVPPSDTAWEAGTWPRVEAPSGLRAEETLESSLPWTVGQEVEQVLSNTRPDLSGPWT